MSSINPLKPILSSIITLFWLGCFVLIDTSSNGYLQSFWNFDEPTANAIKWGLIAAVGILWLVVQLFLDAPGESSRLSLTISGTILWLGLILFYRFADPAFGGAVAFFALVGGLAVVIVWTRYLSDDFA